LRTDASTSSEVIRRIPYNVTLTALEERNGYYYVDFLGTFGWISVDFSRADAACER
jgi:hypothetical protein